MDAEPIPGWWEDPRLAWADGARTGYAAGVLEALEVAAELWGPWRFDADAVWRGLERRAERDRERMERRAPGGTPAAPTPTAPR